MASVNPPEKPQGRVAANRVWKNAPPGTRVVVVPPELVERLGVLPAYVLSQLYYWQGHVGFGTWFYKTADDLSAELRIPNSSIRRTVGFLKRERLLETKLRGWPPLTYFRLDDGRISSLFGGADNAPRQSRSAPTKKPNETPENEDERNPPQFAQNEQITICSFRAAHFAQNEQISHKMTSLDVPLDDLCLARYARQGSPRSARLAPDLAPLGLAASEPGGVGLGLADSEREPPEDLPAPISRCVGPRNSSGIGQPGAAEGLMNMKQAKLGGKNGLIGARLGGRAAFEALPKVANGVLNQRVHTPAAPDPSDSPQDEAPAPTRGAAPPTRSERSREAAVASRAEAAAERAQVRAEARELRSAVARDVGQPVAGPPERPEPTAGPAAWDQWVCATTVRSKREGGGVRPPADWTAPDFDRFLAVLNKTTFPDAPVYVASGKTRGQIAQWLKTNQQDGLTGQQRRQLLYDTTRYLFCKFHQFQRDNRHKLSPPLTPGLMFAFFDTIRQHEQAPKVGSNRAFHVEDYPEFSLSTDQYAEFQRDQDRQEADRKAQKVALWAREAAT